MRTFLTVACTVIVMLAIMAGVMMNIPASAQVSAALADESTAEVVVVYVTADGDYKINREGNNPAEILTVASVNSRLEFDLGGKKSFQIQNIVPEDESKIWKMTTDDGWFGLDDSVQTADTSSPATAAALPTGQEAYQLSDLLAEHKGENVDCAMYLVEPSKKLMTWNGGGSWVHTCQNEEAKQLMLDGYQVRFTMDVDFQVRACRSHWVGVDLNGNVMNPYTPAGCWDIPFRAGTYTVDGWAYDPLCLVQVGFRAIPNNAAEWNEERTCEHCVWPFPQAKSIPTYQDAASRSVSSQPATSVPTSSSSNSSVGSIPSANYDEWQRQMEERMVSMETMLGMFLCAQQPDAPVCADYQ